MRQYILRRLVLLVPVVFGVSVLVFAIIHLIPGDIAVILAGSHASAAELNDLRTRLGLNQPLPVQYVLWIWNVLHLDFGKSLISGGPVINEILRRLPVTLELALLTLVVSLVIAIPAGIISATRQNSKIDYLARFVSIFGLSIPGFWLGTLLILLPSIWFRWTPPIRYVPFVDDPLVNLQQVFMPAIAMGAAMSAVMMRMTRSQLLEVMRHDYIRTAWAKGLRERVVIVKHALKNAMIPIITILGNQFGYLMGGTVIMEQVFSLPGVGRLMYESIFFRDYPMVQGNVLFIATIFVGVNLVVDLIYAWFDPRIRYT